MSEPPPSEPSLAVRYRRAPRMVSRRIGQQSVLVPVAGDVAEVDSVYTLNRVGAFLWDRFDGLTDGHTHIAALVGRFEVDQERAARDYLSFVAELVTIGAVVVAATDE